MHDMLKTLKFVQGAVGGGKALVPELKHYVIQHGRVRSFNGVIALSSPIDMDAECAPEAKSLYAAIGNCTEQVALALTPSNRLRISSAGFTVHIDCVEMDGLPVQEPRGKLIELDGIPMLQAIKTVAPFVGSDASRVWTNGILLKDQSAFATNNVCLVQYWLGVQMPFTVNIPGVAIKEILRIGTEPTHAHVSDNSITLHYADGRWLRTQVYEVSPWERIPSILDRNANAQPVPDALFTGLEQLKPFMDKSNRIYFMDGEIRTTPSAEVGASVAVEGLPESGIYNRSMLALLGPVAKSIDFSLYPDPLVFYGDNLRGVIIGQTA